jgi:hypothetical protein
MSIFRDGDYVSSRNLLSKREVPRNLTSEELLAWMDSRRNEWMDRERRLGMDMLNTLCFSDGRLLRRGGTYEIATNGVGWPFFCIQPSTGITNNFLSISATHQEVTSTVETSSHIITSLQPVGGRLTVGLDTISEEQIKDVEMNLNSTAKLETLAVALGVKLGCFPKWRTFFASPRERGELIEWIVYLRKIFPHNQIAIDDERSWFVSLESNSDHPYIQNRTLEPGKALGYVCGDMKGWDNPCIDKTIFEIKLTKRGTAVRLVSEVCPYPMADMKARYLYRQFVNNAEKYRIFEHFGYTVMVSNHAEAPTASYTDKVRELKYWEFPE